MFSNSICAHLPVRARDWKSEINAMWSVLPFPISHVPSKRVNHLQQAHSQRPSFHKIPMLSVPLRRISRNLLTLWLGRKWFDCAECHQEQEDHSLLQRFVMVYATEIFHVLTFSNGNRRPLRVKNARNAFEKMLKSSKTGG